MKIIVFTVLIATSFFGLRTMASESSTQNFMHVVFFELVDNSRAAKEALAAACKQYLAGHEGEIYFATGSIAEDKARDVNVRDFDVSLVIVFDSEAAQNAYQEHPRHKEFIEENSFNWEKVRVFDSNRH